MGGWGYSLYIVLIDNPVSFLGCRGGSMVERGKKISHR